jgi:WD40 repeat protein
VCTLEGNADRNSVTFSPDGTRVASGSGFFLLKIWSTETGALVSSFVGVRQVR